MGFDESAEEDRRLGEGPEGEGRVDRPLEAGHVRHRLARAVEGELQKAAVRQLGSVQSGVAKNRMELAPKRKMSKLESGLRAQGKKSKNREPCL